MTDAAEQLSPRERAELFIEQRATDLARGPVLLSATAKATADMLAAEDPEAWADFSTEVVNEVISSRLRSHLARIRQAAVRGERLGARRGRLGRLHDDVVNALNEGDDIPSPFAAEYAAPGTNLWLRLGAMRRPDLLAVSAHRAGLARTNGIEAVFLKAIADRLPDDDTTVEQAMTADDILRLHTKAEHADLGDLPNEETNEEGTP